ncbi:MAG: DNA methyltransferase [Ignavibacteriales bacterium]|nr:DNA methyltransferase [Ignavibacteriales bacterium]
MKKLKIPHTIGEFWTSKQRQASSLHEVSYRACFKPQLPKFFIDRYSNPGDIVYDPFTGRGTTIIEAALCGRNVISNDVSPLSRILTEPRLRLPAVDAVAERLESIPLRENLHANIDLSMFYHPETESELVSLQHYLRSRRANRSEDNVDRWIRMVATNRLTGHSVGFFSVYTLPPNQAATQEQQKRINTRRRQRPSYRSVRAVILKKSRQLMKDVTDPLRGHLEAAAQHALFLNCDARTTRSIEKNSVQLTVTSPPFLNIVNYSADNWLRCWFNGIDDRSIAKKITVTSSLDIWCDVMGSVFQELFRITRPGGWVAFEVGEVRKGTVKLEEQVIPLAQQAGFRTADVFINTQKFTKTANIWGIQNNAAGTNTNRIVLLSKT